MVRDVIFNAIFESYVTEVSVMRMHAVILTSLLALAWMFPAQAAWAQEELRSSRFQTSDGVELHYLEAGSGPTLVLVPGWTMPAWIWEHQIRHFASTHRVVALDPRGQGRSEKPTHGYHATRRGRDICELLEHLGGKPAVVVGWSIAAQEIFVCAHEIGTDAMRAVVVVDWPIDMEADKNFATDRIRSLQSDRRNWTRGFVEAIHQSSQSEEYLGALTEAALSMPTNASAMVTANWYFLGPTDLGPVLDVLELPVLFVYSSLDWAMAAAEEVREGWPDAPVEVIDETSHALFVDRPEQFNRVLGEFLSSLPE
jgi:microsomal epoxide hydrolase